MKELVVCDTNIWYRIGSGEINPKEIESGTVATFNSIYELYHSENLYYDPIAVKNALKALKSADYIIFKNPFDHILLLDNPNYKPDETNGQFMISEANKFCNIPDGYTS